MKAKYSLLKVFERGEESKKDIKKLRRWTKEEDQYLIDNTSNSTLIELAEALNRTTNSIAKRTKYLRDNGINFAFPKRKKREDGWIDEDDKFIIRHYGKMPIAQMAKKLKRAYSTTYRRVGLLRERGEKIKISKNPPCWTEEEIAYLKERYSTAKREELEKKLNRTKSSILTKASRLGLKKENRGIARGEWTEARKKFVRENYKKRSVQEIADILGVSYSLVATMASRMGVTTPQWTKEEEEYLMENYCKCRLSYLAKELGRSVSAVRNKAFLMGLTR